MNMSTNTLDRTDSHLDIKSVIRFDVQNLQATLADFVREKMDEQNLSTYDVERRSGGAITHGSVWNILNQRVKDVKAGTLRALAKGLGVSEEEVFDAARGKEPVKDSGLESDNELAALFYEYKELADDDKEELRAVMEMVRQEIRRRKQAGELVSQRKAREKASKRR